MFTRLRIQSHHLTVAFCLFQKYNKTIKTGNHSGRAATTTTPPFILASISDDDDFILINGGWLKTIVLASIEGSILSDVFQLAIESLSAIDADEDGRGRGDAAKVDRAEHHAGHRLHDHVTILFTRHREHHNLAGEGRTSDLRDSELLENWTLSHELKRKQLGERASERPSTAKQASE